MGHFTLARLRARLRKGDSAFPRISAQPLSEPLLNMHGISDQSCVVFTLVAQLGLSSESKPSPELSQCEKKNIAIKKLYHVETKNVHPQWPSGSMYTLKNLK